MLPSGLPWWGITRKRVLVARALSSIISQKWLTLAAERFQRAS
jgi:hypothetical protein